MRRTNQRTLLAKGILAFVSAGASLLLAHALPAAPPLREGSLDQFAQLQRMIKPQPGESRWMDIAWLPSVWEARQKAAAEGKPIFFWAGSGGAPSVNC